MDRSELSTISLKYYHTKTETEEKEKESLKEAHELSLHPSSSQQVLSLRVQILSGTFDVDLYLPAIPGRAPLVIVAHGFWRSKAKMAQWGSHLAEHGFAVAVPTLPSWANHARNGRAIQELIDWIGANIQRTK